MPNNLRIRHATREDMDTIEALRLHSAEVLTASHYAKQQLDAALTAGAMDFEMIEARSFFLGVMDGAVAGTAAWSENPDVPGVATIRSVYVHPALAARGIGRELLGFVEGDASNAGYARLELHSSLSGVGFYRRLGYEEIGPLSLDLSNGIQLPVMQMRKTLAWATCDGREIGSSRSPCTSQFLSR